MASHFELKPFQKTTVEYGIKHPYSILGLGPGLGKTFTSLSIAKQTVTKTLIICPSYLKLKWKYEIEKFFPGSIVSLFNSDREFYPIWDSEFVIISSSFIGSAEIFFEWADLIVADEAHEYKTLTTQRTQALHKQIYENSNKRCLLLTGTPIKNRVWELYSLIAICNYNPTITKSLFLEKFPSYVDFANYFSFLKEYAVETKRGSRLVQTWEGFRNIDELKEKWLKDIYIRFDSSVLDLPEFNDIDIQVSYEDWPELLDSFNSFTEGGENSGVNSALKAEAALVKAPFTAKYAKDLLMQEDQVVIFTDHVDSCEYIAKELGVVAITGSLAMSKRQEIADKFQNKEIATVVATIGSFSTGIDLFSANHMILNDLPWVSGDLIQAKDRIRRIGQTNKCFYHFMLGTIQDAKIRDILNEKNKTIKAVI